MKKTQCYIIFVFLSFLFFVYMIDNITRDTRRGGAREEGRGDESSLPFNFPHPVETMTEARPYHYFEGTHMYGRETEREISTHEDLMLSRVKEVATQTLQRNTPLSLSTPAFLSGRYRWLPDGLEHDLLYKDQDSEVTKRVILFQRLSNVQVVRSIQVNHTKDVHIILTLKGRLDKYQTFLQHLATSVLPQDKHITLTVAYFNDANLTRARNITSAQFSSFPNFKWTLLPLGKATGDEGFSRGKGLHLGALQATREDSDLIFFCDVDVLMQPDFLTRCRANTLLGRQVYYPMVFSLYNPKLVYPLQEQSVPSVTEQLRVGEDTGFFRDFGFGMSCVCRGDYNNAGGFLDIKVWGGEDEALYTQFLASENMKVIRAPDPSLFHLHHAKQCVAGGGDSAYVSCLKSTATTQGSKVQLGMALLKLQQGTDIEGVLSKKFYYFWLVPYLGALLALSLLTNLLLALLLLMCAKRAGPCKVL